MLNENVYHRSLAPLRLALMILLLSAAPAWCEDLVLAWDPNMESDLQGYGIYFKDATESAYSLYGYVSIQELADPNSPRFIVSDLEPGNMYYFVGTAYDWYGLESTFSNTLCVEVGDTVSPCPSAAEGSSGGGGGSGGACFIDSLFY